MCELCCFPDSLQSESTAHFTFSHDGHFDGLVHHGDKVYTVHSLPVYADPLGHMQRSDASLRNVLIREEDQTQGNRELVAQSLTAETMAMNQFCPKCLFVCLFGHQFVKRRCIPIVHCLSRYRRTWFTSLTWPSVRFLQNNKLQMFSASCSV